MTSISTIMERALDNKKAASKETAFPNASA
jgi:hypothetical protein